MKRGTGGGAASVPTGVMLLLALVYFQVETAGYLAVNAISSRLRSVSLMTETDRRVRGRARSLWLYLSFVPYCLMAVFDFGSLRRMLRILACLLLTSFVSYRSFLKFPSSYPRPRLDGDGGDDVLGVAWRSLRSMDRPANTFPSIHVGHTFFVALALSRHLPRERGDAHVLWALLIALSTLTTKQHYAVDVTGGILVAEAIVAAVYEPWERGQLSWRRALRELRALLRRLDALARHPVAYRLHARERHPRLRRLLSEFAVRGSLTALYASASGKSVLFQRKRLLVEELRRRRRVLELLLAPAPGWLQFVRHFEVAEPELSEERVGEYLRELEPDLRRVLLLLVDLSELPRQRSHPTPRASASATTRPPAATVVNTST